MPSERRRVLRPAFRLSAIALVVIGATGGFASALAADAPLPVPRPEPDAAPVLPIARLTFLGTRVLSAHDLQRATADFVGRPADRDTLAALRKRVQAAYDQAGYSLVAVAPPGTLPGSGTVIVRVSEFDVSDIRITGGVTGADAALLRQLPSLSAGATPQFDRLTRELFLFNDNPRRKAALNFEPDGSEHVRAKLAVERRRPVYGSLGLDNNGTRQTGYERVRASAGHADLLGRGIVGELSAVTSTGAADIRQGMARLSMPVLASGGTVDVSVDHARSDLGSVLVFNSISGRSTGVRAGYRHPVMRRTDLERFVELSLEQRSFDDVYDFSGVNLGSSVATRPLTLGYSSIGRGRRIVQSGFSVTGNVPGGGDNADSHYAASRSGATKDWMRINANAALLGSVGPATAGLQFSARLSGQYSADPLVSGEQFRAGGPGLLRGLIEGELAGDSGLAGSLELASGWPAPLRSFVFADAGRMWRNANPVGSPGSVAAVTTGLGLRSPADAFITFELAVGYVLADDELPESDRGEARVHASMRMNF